MVLLLTAVTITLHKNATVDTTDPHDTNYRLCGFSITLIVFYAFPPRIVYITHLHVSKLMLKYFLQLVCVVSHSKPTFTKHVVFQAKV